MHFPALAKSWILGTLAEVMEKSWNFSLLSKYLVLLENWKHSPCHRANICPKKAGFSAFLSHGKFKLVMEKSWKSHYILFPNFCVNPASSIHDNYLLVVENKQLSDPWVNPQS